MAQPSEIYVDPSIAGDSGTGTVGDPFGDLEYGIEQTTFDTTNGTRVNIKAGTDEVVAVEISAAMADTGTTVAWAPTITTPCIFQGYTTAAGDGGKGGISGGGSVSVYDDAAFDYVFFIDLHCHNTGSATVIRTDDECGVFRCEIDNTSGNGIQVDRGLVIGNYVHNVGGEAIRIVFSGNIMFNYIENGTNDCDIALRAGNAGVVYRNIVKIDGASNGIHPTDRQVIMHNSVWSAGGTGQGIAQVNNVEIQMISNNLIEGFSGTGGVGYDLNGTNQSVDVYTANASYDNATHYTGPSYYVDRWASSDTNETLSASPFTDATNGDFSPVDTGSVKEGSLPEDFGDGQ